MVFQTVLSDDNDDGGSAHSDNPPAIDFRDLQRSGTAFIFNNDNRSDSPNIQDADTPSRSLSPDVQATGSDLHIPNSVKGAPEELKSAIRKKQNKESARRSRKRKQDLLNNMVFSISTLLNKIHGLENRVKQMEMYLSNQGYKADDSQLMVSNNNANLDMQGLLISNHGEGGGGMRNERREEEDIDNLINLCLNQSE